MKKKLFNFLIPLSLSINAYAGVWEDHWVRAVEYCDNKNYKEAEVEFNSAILELEKDKDETHPHVYVDRARLFALQERYSDALLDVNKALSSDCLSFQDRMRGLLTRIFAYINLQMDEQAMKDYEEYRSLNLDRPQTEFFENKVIIRNVPQSSCYKKIVTAFAVASGLCESENDVKFYDSGICIIKKKPCSLSCPIYQNVIKQSKKPKPSITPYQESINNCKWWCDKTSLLGIAWCYKVFGTIRCQTGCLLAVDLIKDGCYWCCNDGNFYDTCCQPFEDILSRIGERCDPYWD